MKPKVIVIAILLLATSIAFFISRKSGTIENYHAFPTKLSAFGLFEGNLKMLLPAKGVEVLELSSTLFTDYAEKQRLLKLPKGGKIITQGDGLPKFPEGTILAKTFFYSNKNLPKSDYRIIETRILLFESGVWSAAVYQWNSSQTEAFQITEGAVVKQNIETGNGVRKTINYKIPSHNDCSSCHRSFDKMIPIGPKIRNLNRIVIRNGHEINQLDDLKKKDLISLNNEYSALPSYADKNVSIEKRARAYLEINCAHCHNPSGLASSQTIDLNYQTSFSETGIKRHQINILHRMQMEGSLHMPKLGTTIHHEEGIALIRSYVELLKKQ